MPVESGASASGAERRRRRSGGRTAVAGVACAISGCTTAASVVCGRCARTVCLRHAGMTRAPVVAETARGGRHAGLPHGGRCAQCRLEERRRGQQTTRRIWWGISGLGFAVMVGLALRTNVATGVALLALSAVVLAIAFVYDRMLRRNR